MKIEHMFPNANQMDELISGVMAVAGALGGDASGVIKHFSQMRAFTRLGVLNRMLAPGDLIAVPKESGISATVTGSVTAASVTEDTFLAKIGSSKTAAYEFIFDGAVWKLNGEAVELSVYGVTATGTPTEGDAITVHVQANTVYFEIADFDHDVSAERGLEHVTTMISRDVLSYGTIPFSSPQALKTIAADEFQDGIPAGSVVDIVLDHGCYNNTTDEDGTYCFTAAAAIPVGYKIRHSTIGTYLSSGYGVDHVLGGKFLIYDASGTKVAEYETSAGAGAVHLGTATAETKSYMSGAHLNATRRNAYGSNRAAHSAIKKWLNSAAAGAGSGEVASWWTASDEFDMPVRTTLPGFLHGLDQDFVACLGRVRKRTLLHAWDRADGGAKYEDTEELVWQPSMTELGYGNNDGVAETSPDADGNLKSTKPFALYDGATDADRVKTQGGTARYWFHRSPSPSSAYNVRSSVQSGALNVSSAYSAYGAVAGLQFI